MRHPIRLIAAVRAIDPVSADWLRDNVNSYLCEKETEQEDFLDLSLSFVLIFVGTPQGHQHWLKLHKQIGNKF